MFEIVYQAQAVKALRRMPKPLVLRFIAAFSNLAQGQTDGLDIKPLQGRSGFRLRIGQYRAIYELDNGKLLIMVLKIGSRGDIYK